MKFVAQAVCLKKDEKHLAEQVFQEAARIMEEGQCDWTKILEKSILTQMLNITRKGQKLYTSAPIWQALYEHVKSRPVKKRSKEVGGSSGSVKAAGKSQEMETGKDEGGKRKATTEEPGKAKKAKQARVERIETRAMDQTQPAKTALEAQEELRSMLGDMLQSP